MHGAELPEWEGLDLLQAEATLKAEAALGLLGREAAAVAGNSGEAAAAGEGRLIHEDEDSEDVEVSPTEIVKGAESGEEHDEL